MATVTDRPCKLQKLFCVHVCYHSFTCAGGQQAKLLYGFWLVYGGWWPGAKSINRAHVRPSVPWSSGTMGQGDSGQFNNGQVHNVTMSRWDIGPRDKRLRDNGPMSSETMDIGTKGTETMRRGTMYN